MKPLLALICCCGYLMADPGITIEIDIFTPSNPDPDIVKDANGNTIVGI